MQERRFAFGKWLPDLPPIKQQGNLSVCRNVVPEVGSYSSVGALTNLDSFALSATPRGALRGKLSDGTNLFFAGTSLTLERLIETGWADLSRAAGYTPATKSRWSSTQFGSSVFFTNRADPLQGIDLSSEIIFSDVEGAPRAAIAKTNESFLWLGDIVSLVNGVARDAVAWSAVNGPYTWHLPDTDLATAALSGEQILEGAGGEVMGIVPGSEVTAIFQENAIHRADFVGNDLVWRFTRMEIENGLLVKEAAVAYQRSILYLSTDGWRVFNYTNSQNIGYGVLNDFFFDDWDADYPDSLTMQRDPVNPRIYVSYASKEATAGIPDRMLVWDFLLNQWSAIYPGDHYPLIAAGGIAPSLDSAGTADDPDRIAGTPADDTGGSLNATTSFDDRILGAGRVAIGAFDSSFRLASFTGATLPGVLETGDLELAPGSRSLLSAVRPLVDGEETNVQVAGLARRAQDVAEIEFGEESPMEDDGACYMTEDARYHRIRFNLPAVMTDASEFDVEYSRTSKR